MNIPIRHWKETAINVGLLDFVMPALRVCIKLIAMAVFAIE